MAEKTTDDTALDIDWLKTFAGAMAAVTTALLLSTLGAAGTLIGAALGSVAATVGTALYAQGLAKSKATVAKAQETAIGKVGVAQAEVRRAGRADDEDSVEAHLELADERLAEAKAELDEVDETGPPPLRDQLALLSWKRVTLGAAATFVVVVLAITGFELLTGQSLSSRTGGSSDGQGSTIGGVTGDEGGGKGDRPQKPDPSEDPSPSEDPTPSDDPTPSESATPTEQPSSEPTPTPSETPTGTPTPTPTASGSATP